MDKFRRIIQDGFHGYTTEDAKNIIRNSAEVTAYINEKREHLSYVQQLMNDKIIDEAMGRVKAFGEFGYNKDNGFYYRRHNPSQQLLQETNQQRYQDTRTTNEMESMRNEIERLKRENNDLKRRLR